MVVPGVHKQFCGVAFLSSYLSVVLYLLYFFVLFCFSSQRHIFLIHQPKSWDFNFSTLLCTFMIASTSGTTERELKMQRGIDPTLLRSESTDQRKTPSLRMLVLAGLHSRHWIASGLQCEEIKKKRKKSTGISILAHCVFLLLEPDLEVFSSSFVFLC